MKFPPLACHGLVLAWFHCVRVLAAVGATSVTVSALPRELSTYITWRWLSSVHCVQQTSLNFSIGFFSCFSSFLFSQCTTFFIFFLSASFLVSLPIFPQCFTFFTVFSSFLFMLSYFLLFPPFFSPIFILFPLFLFWPFSLPNFILYSNFTGIPYLPNFLLPTVFSPCLFSLRNFIIFLACIFPTFFSRNWLSFSFFSS